MIEQLCLWRKIYDKKYLRKVRWICRNEKSGQGNIGQKNTGQAEGGGGFGFKAGIAVFELDADKKFCVHGQKA